MIIATKINSSSSNFLIEEEFVQTLQNGQIVRQNTAIMVVGIDEAGRGPLAGPVVAAIAMLDKNNYPKNLNDSKKLSPKIRAEIFLELQKNAKFGIGIIDEKIIDKINILNATKFAMRRAFEDFCQKYQIVPNAAIVDGNFIPDINCPAKAVIKGDQKSLSIAAASVIAKETRDKIMFELGKEFPQYNWQQNKGYPTKSHFEAIKQFGISKYHRQSFTLFK